MNLDRKRRRKKNKRWEETFLAKSFIFLCHVVFSLYLQFFITVTKFQVEKLWYASVRIFLSPREFFCRRLFCFCPKVSTLLWPHGWQRRKKKKKIKKNRKRKRCIKRAMVHACQLYRPAAATNPLAPPSLWSSFFFSVKSSAIAFIFGPTKRMTSVFFPLLGSLSLSALFYCQLK